MEIINQKVQAILLSLVSEKV